MLVPAAAVLEPLNSSRVRLKEHIDFSDLATKLAEQNRRHLLSHQL